MVRGRECLKDLSPYIPGEPISRVKERFGLSEVIKLASNENPYGASERARRAFEAAFDSVFLYPDGACAKLRGALAERLSLANADKLVFGCGTDELIALICNAFLETGDTAITGEISFAPYEKCALAAGGRVVKVPMRGFSYDLERMALAVTPETRIIFFANPNNPTGTIFNDEEKIAFLKCVPEDVLVVFDEAYEEYVEDSRYKSSVPLTEKFDNLVVLKTFSKIYGLASLRVGYGVMRERYVRLIEKIRKPFNVSGAAQEAAFAALEDVSHTRLCYEKNVLMKRFCYEKLNEMGLSYIETQANFILICIGEADSGAVFQELMRRGFIIRPGAQYGLNGYVRVSVGTREQMERFFPVFERVLAEQAQI